MWHLSTPYVETACILPNLIQLYRNYPTLAFSCQVSCLVKYSTMAQKSILHSRISAGDVQVEIRRVATGMLAWLNADV